MRKEELHFVTCFLTKQTTENGKEVLRLAFCGETNTPLDCTFHYTTTVREFNVDLNRRDKTITSVIQLRFILVK